MIDYLQGHNQNKSNMIVKPQWELLGPFEMQSNPNFIGQAASVAVDPSNPETVFIGGSCGGIWRTHNALATNPEDVIWKCVSDGYFTLGVTKIAIDPDNTDIPELELELFQEENDSLRNVLFEEHKGEVEDYAIMNSKMGHVEAQLLLEEFGDTSFNERILLPDPQENKSSIIENYLSWKPKFNESIKIRPNPSESYIIIEYAFINKPEDIKIYSSQGVCLKSIPVNSRLGSLKISLNFAPGVYYVKAGNSCKKLVVL